MTLSAMIATASSVLWQVISVHVVYGLGTVPKSYSKESTFSAPHEANGLECGTPYCMVALADLAPDVCSKSYDTSGCHGVYCAGDAKHRYARFMAYLPHSTTF